MDKLNINFISNSTKGAMKKNSERFLKTNTLDMKLKWKNKSE